MTTIVTRAGKGSPLTHTEVDTNFTNLNTNKFETAAIPLGTLAAPSISFVGDANTGAYSPGADTLAFVTAGNNRVHITSGGLVGIGTSSPTLQFEISNGTNTGYLHPGIGTGLSVGTKNSSSLSLDTNNTTRVTVTSAGLVGIGTTGPSYKLHVSGSTGIIKGESANATFGAPSFSLNDTAHSVEIILTPINGLGAFGTYTNHPLAFYTNNGEKARIDTSGRLLVGTSSYDGNARAVFTGNTSDNATGALDIRRNTTRPAAADAQIGAIRFISNDSTSGNYSYASIDAFSDGASSSNTDIPGRLVFSTTADGASSPTERLRITSAGVLQIADAGDITVGTTTGTKIGTATTQKLGFYNATPVVQPTAVADATTAVDVITQLNNLLAKLRTLGIIAT